MGCGDGAKAAEEGFYAHCTKGAEEVQANLDDILGTDLNYYVSIEQFGLFYTIYYWDGWKYSRAGDGIVERKEDF